jgi:misshapen/NIK-related kinase
VLLREWNFERFFPERSSMSVVESRGNKDNLAYQEKRKIEDMNNKLENRVKNAIFTKNNFQSPQNQKLMNEAAPKSDSRLSNFVRGFRREATDFSLLSKRHSAVFAEQQSTPAKSNSPQKMQRSSAIFQRNRPKGEPVLTDFIAKRDASLGKKPTAPQPQEAVKLRQPANLDFLRMRREKTESVIFVSPRNANFNSPSQLQQVTARGKSLNASIWTHFAKLIVFVSKACRSLFSS